MAENIILENCRILFRNFSGKESKFNPAGKRNFCVLLPSDLAEEMKNDGWNVKWFTPKDPEDTPDAYIQVSFSFDNYPPNIFMIAGNKKTKLDSETVNVLDFAEIQNVDLVIRPYTWEARGNTGIKAYVKNMYVTIVQDKLEEKYSHFDGDNDLDEAPF